MPREPKTLLRDVCWSFAEPVPRSPADLLKAASAYAASVESEDPTKELQRSFPFSDVRIKYEYAIRSSDGDWGTIESEVRVVNAQLATLTGAELLWELHVACAETVGQNDHHFFEGLELDGERFGSEPPTYRVSLGS